MKGFDKQYKSFPDYILKITKQIWEGKDVESIGKFYTEDIPVRSPFGITKGNKPVIDATYATLKEFPDRQLLGEEIIWNGNDDLGYHSSHRILSKGTHMGNGFYGKPTNKKIYYRVIADCACKNNQVYDEWIVRDQGAMVKQIGYSPKEFAHMIIEKEGGKEKAKEVFNYKSNMDSKYKFLKPKAGEIGDIYSNILTNIFNTDYDFRDYARASNIFWPGNKLGHGREDVKKFWNSLKSPFSKIKFSVEHIGWTKENDRNEKVSIRWFFEGLHTNKTIDYENETNSKIFIMGINHAEFIENNIVREWVLFDEVAIWKQILMQK